MSAFGRRSIASVVKVLLDVTWWGVAVTGVLVLAGLLWGSSMHAETSLDLGVPVAFDIDLQARGLPGASIRDVTGTLSMPIQRSPFVFGNLMGFLVALVVGLWVLSQLRALFRSVRDGEPFAPANVRRIRRVSAAVIVAELAWPVVMLFENGYARRNSGSRASSSRRCRPSTSPGSSAA